MKTIILIVVILLYAIVKSEAESECILVAVPLPSNNCHHFVSGQGDACTANSSQNSLQIIVINSRSEYSTLINFLFHEFGKEIQCSRILGVAGDVDSNSARIIHTLANKWKWNFTAAVTSSNFLPFANLGTSSAVDMNPLSHYIEGLVQFMDELNWNRVGLVSDQTQYHQYASVQIEQGIRSSTGKTVVRITRSDSSLRTVLQVKRYGIDVIIVSTDEVTACSILDNASNLNLSWPSYAWIMLNFNTSKCTREMEGVIFLNDLSISENRYPQPLADFEAVYENVNASFTSNEILHKHSYLSILYDSILTVALADHVNISNTTFPGATGQVKIRNGKRLSNISIIQIQNGSTVECGYYDTESKHTYINGDSFMSGNIPRGTILEVYDNSSSVHITLVMCVFIFCFILVTVVFILFIYFRNEPEIKASSVSLSMCMFLGCYLLLLFLPLLLIQSAESLPVSADTVCMTLPVFFGTGLPFPLILATLVVKMLRVYAIFNNPFSYKKKCFTDGALFLYILLLISPSVLILIAWAASDHLVNIRVTKKYDSYVEVHERCFSKHVFAWTLSLLSYFCILLIAVAVVALKTSNIRYKNFRDTKATNAFAFLVIFLTSMTYLYWCIYFQFVELSIPNIRAAEFTLYVGHVALTLTCQFTLFIPKVYPPVLRRLHRNTINKKNNHLLKS